MMRSGFVVKAQRKDSKGAFNWQDTDIMDLSDEEFAQWWISITDDRDKFTIANKLRAMCMSLSDFEDQIDP